MGLKISNTSGTTTVKSKSNGDSIFNREINLFGSRFSNKSKEEFYGELSILLHSGVNLKIALDLISGMQKTKKDQNLVERIANDIVEGRSLYEALKSNDHFTSYEYQAIKIGERTGQLAKITEDLREFFARKNELKRQLISSLSYPIIVLFTAILVVFFMLRYVVPMFEDIFKQNRIELPWLTRQIVKLSKLADGNGLVILMILLLVIVGFKWLSKSNWYHRIIGKIQLKIPVLGQYLRKVYLIQFTQAMALLTNARIPVVNGIGLTREMIHFYPLESSLKVIEQDIIQGEKLNDVFAKHSLFDKKMVALLKVAEETNQTEFIFQKLYGQYSSELKYKGQIITNVFNFLLTLVVGIIVGVILVAMYMPMFKLSSLIG